MDILTRMMAELPLGYRELQALIATAPRRYKIYQIPKRAAGQFRTIAHPSRELKLIQRWLARKVLHALPIHTAAMAYRTGLSISDNAQKHLNQRYLLRLDIKNFFPSIRPIDFIKHCAIHFSPLDAKSLIILTQILFKRNPQTGGLELAIGAPSSPLISNSIFFQLDQKISQYCEQLGIVYTRYADDLTFSTNHTYLLEKIPEFIVKILITSDYPKLILNTEKTTYSSRKSNRQVTGLVLTPDAKISIGRDKKRRIKALVYKHLHGELSSEQVENLRGQLSFIHSVEPGFIQSLHKKYGQQEMTLLTQKRET